MEAQQNSTDIVRQIFLEEQYVDKAPEPTRSAVYLDTEVFSDMTRIKSMLQNFYKLSLLEQQGYLRHLRTIVQALELTNVNLLIDKLFDHEFSAIFVNNNPHLCILLLDAIETVLYMVFEEGKRAKAKTDMLQRSRVSFMLEASMGIMEQPVQYEQELASMSLVIRFCQRAFTCKKVTVKEKLLPVFEKVTKYSSQFERDQKILKFLTEELVSGEIPRIALGLEALSMVCEYFTPTLLELLLSRNVIGFIQHKSSLIREAAFSVFVRLVSILHASTVYKHYSDTIRLMATDQDSDVNIVFISSFSVFIPKLPLRFIKNELLPHYYKFQLSTNRGVRIEFFLSISQVIIKLLQLIKRTVPFDIDCIQEAFRIYFNLILYVEELNPVCRNQILKANYGDLYLIFKIFGKNLWPYLKYTFKKLDAYPDNNTVEQAKLAMVKSVFKLGPVLGQQLLEKEALTIIDFNFLILGPKTTINVKMKALPLVYKLLQEVAVNKRSFFADYYIMLQDDAKKWRIKVAICNQVEHLVKLFEIQDVVSFIFPLMVKLSKDEVAVVRKAAARQFHWLYETISSKANEFMFMLSECLRSFADDPCYHYRIVFLDIFEALLEFSTDDVAQEYGSLLIKLATDRVSGVRIRLAGLCGVLHNKLPESKITTDIVKIFREDKEKEVKRRVMLTCNKIPQNGH